LIPEAVDNTKKPTPETHDQDDLRERILSKVCSNEPEALDLILAYISRLSASEHLTLNQTCVQLRLNLKEEDVDLLEELFVQEGIIFDPSSVADIDSVCRDTASEEISLLMQAVEELKETVEEVASKRPNLHSVRYCCA
jgi:kinesin family protein 5